MDQLTSGWLGVTLISCLLNQCSVCVCVTCVSVCCDLSVTGHHVQREVPAGSRTSSPHLVSWLEEIWEYQLSTYTHTVNFSFHMYIIKHTPSEAATYTAVQMYLPEHVSKEVEQLQILEIRSNQCRSLSLFVIKSSIAHLPQEEPFHVLLYGPVEVNSNLISSWIMFYIFKPFPLETGRVSTIISELFTAV